MAKFEKHLFNQTKFFGMTLLHAHAQYIYIVNAKYQKPSVKALVQVDLKANRQKTAHFTKLLFCQKHFLASNFFMQMFNESVLCRQSIKLFWHKLWYKLNSPHMHMHLYTCHTKMLSTSTFPDLR